jgi:hypothetical protein
MVASRPRGAVEKKMFFFGGCGNISAICYRVFELPMLQNRAQTSWERKKTEGKKF